MAVLQAAPPALIGELDLLHTTDPFLGNAPVLIFHGPAATVGAVSSRIQLHIFTIGGHASYNRLAISPSSPFYTAVRNLPREEQGDESIRGIAFGLRKYFAELSQSMKEELAQQIKAIPTASLFGDDHVAILASRLRAVENVKEVGEDLVRSFAEEKLSWTDLDVILPPGSIKHAQQDENEQRCLDLRYGRYAETISAFGDLSFLPTSRLRRAPSTVSTIGRTASFLRQQKQKARQEVLEFMATEQNYVMRLEELDTLQRSNAMDINQELLDSVSTMLKANQDLLRSIQDIIETTTTSSDKEIESMTSEQPTAQQIRQDLLADNQGIVAFSKCLCDGLPHFREPYACYLKSHELAIDAMRTSLRSNAPPAALVKLGEQRLTSLLIEPIQRLPRYTLYIDEVSKQLPARHPALRYLLKARDMVSSICDDGNDCNIEETIATKLSSRINGWPSDLTGIGRIITAVDYVALRPPYRIETSVLERGMLLLTTDGLAMVEKSQQRSMAARVFLTDIEAARKHTAIKKDYGFLRWLPLSTIECSESHEGQSILLTVFPETVDGSAESSMCLLLEGSYEGKSARFTEDVAKARVEARFSEPERDSPKWEVRASHPVSSGSRLFSAVFEDSDQAHVASRKHLASIRVVLDVDKHSQKHRAGKDGAHTVLAISALRDGTYRMSSDTIDGPSVSEQISLEELSQGLQRKVTAALVARYGSHRSCMLKVRLNHNRDVLQSLQMRIATKDTSVKPFEAEEAVNPLRQSTLRPLSPVKMLSSLLSSSIGPANNSGSTLKKETSGSSMLKAGASFGMLSSTRGISSIQSSMESRPGSHDQPRPKSSSSHRSLNQVEAPVQKLQDTFSAYILAIKARKGNVVGRNLRVRAEANELAVNELYNHLLEHPQSVVLAAQASLDVLFAAFEKFLCVAWTEKLGPVLPVSFLTKTLDKAGSLFPTDFDDYFRSAICALPSPNQTAFREIISLLNDLLDGTGNDADRGALTAAFAEVLVTEGNPIDYISLIDKFVDDADTYFGEPVPDTVPQIDADSTSGVSHKRSRSVNTGSLTSNTSSLRRKFGLGLSRENSKSEHDSKSSSVWRTLSKSRSKEASPGSTLSSRSVLQRAHSTESESRFQERPVSSESSSHNAPASDLLAVPTVPSSVLPGLSTIGEHPSFIPTGPPRKKRRSSLSDLKSLATPFATPQRPNHSPQASLVCQSPSSTVPSTPSSKNNSIRLHTPSRITPRPALPASFRQALSPSRQTDQDGETTRTSSAANAGVVKFAAISPSSKQSQASSIPTLKPSSPSRQPATPQRTGLSERSDGGNIMSQASPRTIQAIGSPASKLAPSSPVKKLRLQSPQKVRDRLQTEQAAIAAAHSSLQDELRKLGEELAATPGHMNSVRTDTLHDQADLASKLKELGTNCNSTFTLLNEKYDKLHTDALASLVAYESRSKRLDELYREANAENEALYARFNHELSRVLKAVRGGDGVVELRQRAKQQEDEIVRLKRDNARLKREIAGVVSK